MPRTSSPIVNETTKQISTNTYQYGKYIFGAVAALSTLGLFGFLAYKNYKGYYEASFGPDGSIKIKPVHGAQTSAENAKAHGDLTAVALGKGPVKTNVNGAQSETGNINASAINSNTPVSTIDAVLGQRRNP